MKVFSILIILFVITGKALATGIPTITQRTNTRHDFFVSLSYGRTRMSGEFARSTGITAGFQVRPALLLGVRINSVCQLLTADQISYYTNKHNMPQIGAFIQPILNPNQKIWVSVPISFSQGHLIPHEYTGMTEPLKTRIRTFEPGIEILAPINTNISAAFRVSYRMANESRLSYINGMNSELSVRFKLF